MTVREGLKEKRPEDKVGWPQRRRGKGSERGEKEKG